MAKTIKFNLICDGNYIRTLEDLRNNFSIEDVLEYYHNQLLQRWLSVRGYEDQLRKVQSIKVKDEIDILPALIDIFEVEADKEKVHENTFILKYKKEHEFLLEEYQKMNYKADAIIDDYHAGYQQLVDTIIENRDDMAKIKASIAEIDNKYSMLYQLDYRNLFYVLKQEAPLAIFAMLMNDSMRTKYLPIITENEDGTIVSDVSTNTDKYEMYKKICEFIPQYATLKDMIGENLKEFAGLTDGYWKDVEAKGNKYMIIRMEIGNIIRSSGESGGDLDVSKINNQFVILDGIDYKSNNASHKLLYMEV